jgi:hypothetical protein
MFGGAAGRFLRFTRCSPAAIPRLTHTWVFSMCATFIQVKAQNANVFEAIRPTHAMLSQISRVSVCFLEAIGFLCLTGELGSPRHKSLTRTLSCPSRRRLSPQPDRPRHVPALLCSRVYFYPFPPLKDGGRSVLSFCARFYAVPRPARVAALSVMHYSPALLCSQL